jgi:hypothetical protein
VITSKTTYGSFLFIERYNVTICRCYPYAQIARDHIIELFTIANDTVFYILRISNWQERR